MPQFESANYGPIFGKLLAGEREMPLDAVVNAAPSAGAALSRDEARELLESVSLEEAFPGQPISDQNMARACVAGVWLLYDFLGESHQVSQTISTPEGSYWHAIMHRREGDYSNSKYWFRKVGDHPVFVDLADLVSQLEGTVLPRGSQWDPYAFVDACERAVRGGSNSEKQSCRQVQHLEWQLLFDYCYRHAVT